MKASRVASLALVLLLGLLGCQQQPAAPAATQPAAAATGVPKPPATAAASAPSVSTAAPTAAPPAAAPEAIKVGISASLTGAATRVGTGIDHFIRLAIEDINGKGGFTVAGKRYVFQPVTVDDKGTSEGGRDAADRLVLAEKVRFVLGSISGPGAGAQAITEPNKIPLLAFTVQDKSLGTSFPLTVQLGLSHTNMRTQAIYDWIAKEHPEVKRIAAVMTDDAAGRNMADLSETLSKGRGISVASKEFFPTDIKDFSAIVTRVLRQNPQGIDTAAGARGPLFLAMTKSLNEQGYNGITFGASGDSNAMREGASFIKSYTYATLYDYKTDTVSEAEREIMQRYVKKYGEAELEPPTLPAYNIPLVLAQAIEKAGSLTDAEQIVKTLRAGEWDTMWSKKWGKSRLVGAKTLGLPAALEQPIYLTKVEGGKISTFTAFKGTMP